MPIPKKRFNLQHCGIASGSIVQLRDHHRQKVTIEESLGSSRDRNEHEIVEIASRRTRTTRGKRTNHNKRHTSDPDRFAERLLAREERVSSLGTENRDAAERLLLFLREKHAFLHLIAPQVEPIRRDPKHPRR